MSMTAEELSYGAAVISGAPVNNTNQMRHKAAWLERLADELDLLKQNETVVSPENNDKE